MGASSKTGKALLPDDHKMGREKCKRQRSPEQQAKRAAKKAAHDAAKLLGNMTIAASHGPAIGCKTGDTGAMTPKQRREAITNLCGPSANAGNGPKQGIHNHTHKLNRERKLGLDAAWRKEYAEAEAAAQA